MNKLLILIVLLLVCNPAYSAGLDANTKLLLHFTEADGTTGVDGIQDSSDNDHTITAVNQAATDDGVTKFDNTLLLPGDDDELTVPASADFDIVASDSDSWTVDLWVKHDVYGGDEAYTYQTDGLNQIIFRHRDGSGVQFLVANPSIAFTVDGDEIDDSNWHHVALIKTANEYGVYIDGTQSAYVQDSTTLNLNDLLYIGSAKNDSFFNGNFDEFRIQKSNYFGVTLDTSAPFETGNFTPPTEEYSSAEDSRGSLMIIAKKFIPLETGGYKRVRIIR